MPGPLYAQATTGLSGLPIARDAGRVGGERRCGESKHLRAPSPPMRMNLLRSEQCPPPHLSSPYGLSLSVFLVCIYTREEFDVYFSFLSEDVVCVF